jgi:RHS repeat-associated protein
MSKFSPPGYVKASLIFFLLLSGLGLFSNSLHGQETVSFPRIYSVHSFDSELGLYRANQRFYSSETGLFTTPDPFYLSDPELCLDDPISCNLYSYSENSPLSDNDPSGLVITRSMAKPEAKASKPTVKAHPKKPRRVAIKLKGRKETQKLSGPSKRATTENLAHEDEPETANGLRLKALAKGIAFELYGSANYRTIGITEFTDRTYVVTSSHPGVFNDGEIAKIQTYLKPKKIKFDLVTNPGEANKYDGKGGTHVHAEVLGFAYGIVMGKTVKDMSSSLPACRKCANLRNEQGVSANSYVAGTRKPKNSWAPLPTAVRLLRIKLSRATSMILRPINSMVRSSRTLPLWLAETQAFAA